MTAEFLREIPETAASGSTAEVYRDIRRVLAVPLVNLVYRHLATFPGLLADAWWRDLRLNLKSAVITSLPPALGETAEDVDATSIPLAALLAIGVDEDERERARATLDVYARANTRNLVAVIALLDGAPGTAHDPVDVNLNETEESVAPFPIVQLSELDAPVLALLGEMGSAIAGPGAGVFVPSLLRHFADRPALLALFWTVLQPALAGGKLEQAASRIDSRARAVAAELPFPVSRLDHADARASLERFALAIPRMIVVETLLRRSVGRARVR